MDPADEREQKMQAYAGQLVETAFTEHRAGLVRHLTVVTRDSEAAEDLAQESFLRLVREVDGGRSPDDVAAWLHRVGMNLATSRGRHLQVAQRREAELPQPAAPADPEDAAVDAEMSATLSGLLGGLTDPERRALTMAATGHDGGEIAASIGRTPGATRTLMCRARTKLRQQMLGQQMLPIGFLRA